MDIPEGNREANQRHLRGGRRSEPAACYSITKTLRERKPLLMREQNGRVVVESLSYCRDQGWMKLLAFCVMPDHFHLLAVLLNVKPLSELVATVSKFTSRRMKKGNAIGSIWQEGFFDHRCRDEDDALERIAYIENNPVRAGLIDAPSQWPYSSANPEMAGLLDRQWYLDNS